LPRIKRDYKAVGKIHKKRKLGETESFTQNEDKKTSKPEQEKLKF
jgi:hypothetical protein